jgi:hypothetical protein
MGKYKVIATIEVTVEAEDFEEAEAIGLDGLCWSNADIEVLEEEDKSNGNT